MLLLTQSTVPNLPLLLPAMTLTLSPALMFHNATRSFGLTHAGLCWTLRGTSLRSDFLPVSMRCSNDLCASLPTVMGCLTVILARLLQIGKNARSLPSTLCSHAWAVLPFDLEQPKVPHTSHNRHTSMSIPQLQARLAIRRIISARHASSSPQGNGAPRKPMINFNAKTRHHGGQ